MWTCPKCGRTFKRANQGHYCGTAPKTTEEYIELQQSEARPHITELRNLILHCIPGVTERIAWSMPMYQKGEASISFAACKKHVSLYIETDVLESHQLQLREFTIKKNALYLPYDKELPLKILEDIVRESFAVK